MKIIRKFPLHVTLIHVLCKLHLEKNMTVFEKFVKNFTLADKPYYLYNDIIEKSEIKNHEMWCSEDI